MTTGLNEVIGVVADVGTIPALLIGITEVLKKTGVPDRAIPAAVLLDGVLFAAWQGGFSADSIITGITFGLMAMGLWSGTRATLDV